MNKNLFPVKIVAPGRILQRELEARDWTQQDLAKITNRPPQAINEIIRGTKQITPETALELAAALGTSDEFWTNLETNYRLNIAKKNKNTDDIERKSHLYSLAPISELIKRKWVKSAESLDELEKSLCDFFRIASIDVIPQLQANFRQSQRQQAKIESQFSWMKRIEYLVQQQDIPQFNLEQLKTAIPKILACSEEAEQIALVPKLLLSLGIHFAIVSHLDKTYLDGATFYFNNNPVIALTLRYDRIDCFWFTLMHEIGHIVADRQGIYLDNLDSPENNDQEEEANKLAKNWLLDETELQNFIQINKSEFSSKSIEAFAKIQKRHCGIILGRLQHDKLVKYQSLRKFLVRVSPLLIDWIDS